MLQRIEYDVSRCLKSFVATGIKMNCNTTSNEKNFQEVKKLSQRFAFMIDSLSLIYHFSQSYTFSIK